MSLYKLFLTPALSSREIKICDLITTHNQLFVRGSGIQKWNPEVVVESRTMMMKSWRMLYLPAQLVACSTVRDYGLQLDLYLSSKQPAGQITSANISPSLFWIYCTNYHSTSAIISSSKYRFLVHLRIGTVPKENYQISHILDYKQSTDLRKHEYDVFTSKS